MRQGKMKFYCVVFTTLVLLVTHSIDFGHAKRITGSSNRKTSSSGGGTSRHPPSSNTGHVTKPTYNTNSGTNTGNSHADLAKLSYSNYNSQPNRPAAAGGGATQNNAPAIGWNVPKQQSAGPPPSYSASNPVGGAKTNIHEAPPQYHPNNAPPPSYGAASNVHTPITATNAHSVQSSYPVQQMPAGATYHSAGSLPAGATYYPSGHAPVGASYPVGGHMPAGGNYYPAGGHMPAGGGYYPAGGMPPGASYYPSGGVPAGATYIPAGSSLPAGATYYSSPPQQTSSGLGFGSGLAAGAIGGAILGHVLTPSQTKVVEHAPTGNAGGSGGDDKIIIINNGPPGSVTATEAGSGTTVITTGGAAAAAAPNGVAPAPVPPVAAPSDANAPLAPMAPIAPVVANPMMSNPNATTDVAASPAPPNAEQPAPGGIICVPVRVNETDPADSTKMIEVEKVACYPAPPPPPPAGEADPNAQPAAVAPMAAPGDASAPLAPMNAAPGLASQQIQQHPTQATLLPENSSVRTNSAAATPHAFATLMLSSIIGLFVAFGKHYYQ